MLVSICHQPSQKRLIVKIEKATNLDPGSVGKIDPYVKVVCWHKGKIIGKAKTSVKKNDPNPRFDKALLFYLPKIVEQDKDGMKNIKLGMVHLTLDFQTYQP